MSEVLQEYVDSRGAALRVDRAAGVLRGVKLIGLASLNGRRYRPEALSEAVGLYEGAKVNVNHPKDGPLAPRDYRDRLGVIRQVEFRPSEGLFGNLHFNPKHAMAEQLAWDAENNPRNVGFSHNVMARLTRNDAGQLVEAITHVQSVDLVADPAATQGLFEEERPADGGESADDATAASSASTVGAGVADLYTSLTLESLRQERPDLVEQLSGEVLAAEQAASAARALTEATARKAAARPEASEQLTALGAVHSACTSAAQFVRAVRGGRS